MLREADGELKRAPAAWDLGRGLVWPYRAPDGVMWIVGGERICVQAITTDAYVEVIAAASMTAAGAKGFTVTAGAALDANCFTLNRDARSVSALCSAAGPCIVKGFEKR